jgi:hypothetical protein
MCRISGGGKMVEGGKEEGEKYRAKVMEKIIWRKGGGTYVGGISKGSSIAPQKPF